MTLQFSTRNFGKKKKNDFPCSNDPLPFKVKLYTCTPYYTNYEIMTLLLCTKA